MYWLADVHVIPSRNLVVRDGREIRVTPKEMQVLEHLVAAGGEVVTRDALLAAAWPDVVVREDAPTLAVSRIRKALGDDRARPRFVETVPKVGYRMMVAPAASGGVRGPRPARWGVRLGFGAMGLLLVVMTLLFLAVRAGYEEAQRELGEVRVEASG